MNITDWLEIFKKGWASKNIDDVMYLFSDDVEYWENPHKKLSSKKELAFEWQAIHKQSDIDIELKLFSSEKEKHAVIWDLEYSNEKGKNIWSGCYLIKLNDKGFCDYFLQVGESK